MGPQPADTGSGRRATFKKRLQLFIKQYVDLGKTTDIAS